MGIFKGLFSKQSPEQTANNGSSEKGAENRISQESAENKIPDIFQEIKLVADQCFEKHREAFVNAYASFDETLLQRSYDYKVYSIQPSEMQQYYDEQSAYLTNLLSQMSSIGNVSNATSAGLYWFLFCPDKYYLNDLLKEHFPRATAKLFPMAYNVKELYAECEGSYYHLTNRLNPSLFEGSTENIDVYDLISAIDPNIDKVNQYLSFCIAFSSLIQDYARELEKIPTLPPMFNLLDFISVVIDNNGYYHNHSSDVIVNNENYNIQVERFQSICDRVFERLHLDLNGVKMLLENSLTNQTALKDLPMQQLSNINDILENALEVIDRN